MKTGYGVFGRAYEVMFKNDLHDPASIDHELMKNMVLLDDQSAELLYSRVVRHDLEGHELYQFAQQFKAYTGKETIQNVLQYTHNIAAAFDTDFDNMLFGGTEKQILDRGEQTGARIWHASEQTCCSALTSPVACFTWQIRAKPTTVMSSARLFTKADMALWTLFTVINSTNVLQKAPSRFKGTRRFWQLARKPTRAYFQRSLSASMTPARLAIIILFPHQTIII